MEEKSKKKTKFSKTVSYTHAQETDKLKMFNQVKRIVNLQDEGFTFLCCHLKQLKQKNDNKVKQVLYQIYHEKR